MNQHSFSFIHHSFFIHSYFILSLILSACIAVAVAVDTTETNHHIGTVEVGMQCCPKDLPQSLLNIPCVCIRRSSDISFLRNSDELGIDTLGWTNGRIPVLVQPVFNSDRVLDFVKSIDILVDRYIIIQDGPPWFETMPEVVEQVRQIMSNTTVQVDYYIVSERLGVSGMWNMPIRMFPSHPFWIMPEDDISFYPGQAKIFYNDLLDLLSSESEDAEIGFLEPTMKLSPDSPGFQKGGYIIWGLMRRAVLKMGLWDESNFPAFCEEFDFQRKQKLAGVKKKVSNAKVLHNVSVGIKNDTSYHSGTVVSDKKGSFNAEVDRGNKGIQCFYQAAKWGCDLHEYWGHTAETCRYQLPYDGLLSDFLGDWQFLRKRWACILGYIDQTECKYISKKLPSCNGCLEDDEARLLGLEVQEVKKEEL